MPQMLINTPEFFMETFQKLELYKDCLVLGGDFNLVMDLLLDKQGGRATMNVNSQKVAKDFLKEFRLVDVWRQRNP